MSIFLVATAFAQSPPPLSFATGMDIWEGKAVTGHSQEVNDRDRVRINEAYGKLPLSFETNQGQTGKRVKFLARGRGYSLFLTSNEAVLALKRASPESKEAKGAADAGLALSRSTPSESTECVRMKLVGVSPAARESGVDELPGKANYFIGNDPKKWRTNVPTYAKVKYEAVYPGVDLIYYGNQQQLEYDFVVAAGADPKAIRLSFGGARKLSLDEQGNLVLEARHGQVSLERPQVYQEAKGERRAIEGHYVLQAGNTVSFTVASYDHRKPLVIDPALAYSTYLGGSSGDVGLGIAMDRSGNAYVRATQFRPISPRSTPCSQPMAAVLTPLPLRSTPAVRPWCTPLTWAGVVPI
jgi:beta-propeller repeat-containing protein